jgi:hypothetical protein
MTTAPVFPASQIKDIVMADPDIKSISKKGIEMFRVAAELFARSLLSKTFDDARRNKRVTADLRNFSAVVRNDQALSTMLAPFLPGSHASQVNGGDSDHPEEEERPEREEADIKERDAESDSDSDDGGAKPATLESILAADTDTDELEASD